MPSFPVTGLRSVELGVPHVAANETFYTAVWGLEPIARAEGRVYLRGSGTDHHVLSLQARPTTQVLAVSFSARSRADVDSLAARLKAMPGVLVGDPAGIAQPGGGYGFAFRDPEGRVFHVVADQEFHADAGAVPDRPERLAHVVLNSTDVPAATRLFTEGLGFRLSDQTRMMDFLCCNSDHHAVAFARAEAATLHHIAFLMKDLDSVMRGAARMRDSGYAIEWGVGRHGPGNNVFAYFVGPDDVVIEYTAEVEAIDENYVARGPEHWKWPPGKTDRWGITPPPSARMHEAQLKVGFSAEPFSKPARA